MSILHFVIDVLNLVVIAAFASGCIKLITSCSKEFFVGTSLFFASIVLSVIDLFV